MLLLRRAEAVTAQQHLAERVREIEARLHVLQRSTTMDHPNEVLRKTTPPIRLATVREQLPGNDDDPVHLFEVFGRLFEELSRRLAGAGVTPIGPAWSLYDRSDDGLVIAAGMPVTGSVADERVHVVDRPETDVASTMHQGDVRQMGDAYAAVMAWMEANGHTSAGGSAEISLVWDPGRPERSVTELQIALAPFGVKNGHDRAPTARGALPAEASSTAGAVRGGAGRIPAVRLDAPVAHGEAAPHPRRRADVGGRAPGPARRGERRRHHLPRDDRHVPAYRHGGGHG